MQKPIKKAVEASSKEDQIKQSTLNETVAGLEIIKSVRAQSRMRTHWDNSIEKTTHYGKKSHFLSQIVTFFTAFISQFSNIAIVVAGVYLASIGGDDYGNYYCIYDAKWKSDCTCFSNSWYDYSF